MKESKLITFSCPNEPRLLCGTKSNNVTRSEYAEVKRLIHNRVIAKEPDDVQAARMALLKASTDGGKAAAFGQAAYLPTIMTLLAIQLGLYY